MTERSKHERKSAPLNCRATHTLKRQLQAAAEVRGCSLSQEVIYRLERSLRDDDVVQAIWSRLACKDGDHFFCDCITAHVREIMRTWTGTNCTFADDDITALGILAGHAIRAGLHKNAALPLSLIDCIDAHTSEDQSNA